MSQEPSKTDQLKFEHKLDQDLKRTPIQPEVSISKKIKTDRDLKRNRPAEMQEIDNPALDNTPIRKEAEIFNGIFTVSFFLLRRLFELKFTHRLEHNFVATKIGSVIKLMLPLQFATALDSLLAEVAKGSGVALPIYARRSQREWPFFLSTIQAWETFGTRFESHAWQTYVYQKRWMHVQVPNGPHLPTFLRAHKQVIQHAGQPSLAEFQTYQTLIATLDALLSYSLETNLGPKTVGELCTALEPLADLPEWKTDFCNFVLPDLLLETDIKTGKVSDRLIYACLTWLPLAKPMPSPVQILQEHSSCPLSGQPCLHPVRGINCQHGRGFDLRSYLQRYLEGCAAGGNTYFRQCPICQLPCPPKDLVLIK